MQRLYRENIAQTLWNHAVSEYCIMNELSARFFSTYFLAVLTIRSSTILTAQLVFLS